MLPTFGTTNVTLDQLLQRNKNKARIGKYALKLHEHDAAILAAWCDKWNLDRYHMPDAINLLRLLRKMHHLQHIPHEAGVRELAFRIGKKIADTYLGKKENGGKRAATTQDLEGLAQKVAELWKMEIPRVVNEQAGCGPAGEEDGGEVDGGDEDGGDEDEGEEDKEEEDGVDTPDNDGESLARLENAYATPAVIQPPPGAPKRHLRPVTPTPVPTVKHTAAKILRERPTAATKMPKMKLEPETPLRRLKKSKLPQTPRVSITEEADKITVLATRSRELRKKCAALKETIAERETEAAQLKVEVRAMQKELMLLS
ncbi:unnamed protein product [Zymoseptoria tritici ST99CH_3D1]|nr:unnamed protein product [Zymoseptoria tritici ST99CH_3D1]